MSDIVKRTLHDVLVSLVIINVWVYDYRLVKHVKMSECLKMLVHFTDTSDLVDIVK